MPDESFFTPDEAAAIEAAASDAKPTEHSPASAYAAGLEFGKLWAIKNLPSERIQKMHALWNGVVAQLPLDPEKVTRSPVNLGAVNSAFGGHGLLDPVEKLAEEIRGLGWIYRTPAITENLKRKDEFASGFAKAVCHVWEEYQRAKN
jgi:hypothetical protein